MNILDFAEQQGQRAAAFSLANLDFNRQRANTFLTLLLGGAGAMGGVAIGQIGAGGWLWLGALSVSAWWFGLAAMMALRAMRTLPVRSWSGQGWPLIQKAAEFDAYINQAVSEGESPKDCLTLLREMELRKAQSAADEYRAASTSIAQVMDWAVVGASFTPLVPPLVYGVAVLVRYFG